MKKKVISAILAGACALSALSLSATAADPIKYKTATAAGSVTLKASAAAVTPAIEVSVPSSIAAVVNPYGVTVKVGAVEYGATGLASGVYVIKNYTTDQTISVKASGTLTVPKDKEKNPLIDVLKGTVSTTGQVTAAPALNTDAGKTLKGVTNKSIFAYIVGAAGTTAHPEGEEVTADEITKLLPAANIKWTKDKTPVLADATSDTKATGQSIEIAKIKPGIAAEGSNKKQYNYALFTIGGNISDESVKGGWTASDKMTLNVVLDIGITA